MRRARGRGLPLQSALLLLVALVLVVALVPGGVLLNRRLEATLESKARQDLALAPQILADRWAAAADVQMMHAKDISVVPGLEVALADQDSVAAVGLVESAPRAPLESPVLVTANGETWAGVRPTPQLLAGTRRGEMPVGVVAAGDSLTVVALAPVMDGDTWVGAAGVVTPLNATYAGTLSGLTRSYVLVMKADGSLAAASMELDMARELAAGLDLSTPAGLGEVTVGDGRYLVTRAPLDEKATVVFLRDLGAELAVLPELHRLALGIAAASLGLALLFGALFAARLARPVRSLADAAEGFARGDPDAPLPTSGVAEVRQVAETFSEMRTVLAARLRDLEDANRELQDRQDRLAVLQAELMQRDRLAAAGSLLAQLAHEIRNPVANVRNCLEVIRRRAAADPEAREFAEMAIDELLRMHELTEQMMDLHRPKDPNTHCDASRVAREVATLTLAGEPIGSSLDVAVDVEGETEVGISADRLKQVLLNLTRNAAEAMDHRGRIDIRVEGGEQTVVVHVDDDGPGIDPEVLPRVFDPFFTTKDELQGVGLGLFTAEGLVRTYGGRISASNRPDGSGARFRVEIPARAPRTAEDRSEVAAP